jgi:hypothetical protein
MGIAKPSLVGLPFVLAVGDKTKAADASSPTGKRYPVVTFSPDGDLIDWLVNQGRRRRELAAMPERPALPPASVRDPDFLGVVRHESRVEIDPTAIEVTPESPPEAPVTIPGEALREVVPLSAKQIKEILSLADERKVGRIDLANECVRLIGTGNLEAVPATFHTEILRFIDRRASA